MQATSRRKYRRQSRLFYLVAVALLAALYESPGATADETARQILQTAGLRGGLLVQLNAGEGHLAAALGKADPRLFVVGLETNPAKVAAAREMLAAAGLGGRVLIELWNGRDLPLNDNLANAVVTEAGLAPAEVQRVLAPAGAALHQRDGQWVKTVKPRPSEMDEWTHYLRDATGNAVSRDTLVAPPRRLQWVGSPRWSRHHDHMASLNALVAAGNRIFYVLDEGPISSIRLPADWQVIARDAFNGVVLWKRPLPTWNTHLWPLKSGPAQLPRRLVAVEDRVFLPLGLDEPLSALDAATGQIIRDFPETKNLEEVIFSDGVLFTLANPEPSKWKSYQQKYTYVWDNTRAANSDTWAWDEAKRWVVAVRPGDGAVLWKKEAKVAPLTLAADADGVYYHDGEKVVRLDRRNGGEIWASQPVPRKANFPVSFGPILVVDKEVVLFAGGDRKMTAVAKKDGRQLWQQPHLHGGHQSPEDLLVVDHLAWSGAIAGSSDSGLFTGRDLLTGEIKRQFTPDVKTHWFHHRCYRAKAAGNFLLTSRTGIEFVDCRTGHWDINHWVRGGCLYGIMPANGLVYAPMNDCACYVESKVVGFAALAGAAGASTPPALAETARLDKGPAYGAIGKTPAAGPADWPTFRHDAARSGATKAAVGPTLRQAWQTRLGGDLTTLTVAAGKVFVADKQSHAVHALDSGSGKIAWTYRPGGRVDSPPTYWPGRVIFGCADGWMYCLRAEDGQLAWRRLIAPADRRLLAFEQVESVWPLPGSVLALNDRIYAVAGRSMFLDGGLRLAQVDPVTGRLLAETVLDDRVPGSAESLQARLRALTMPVAMPDILASDGKFLYMRSQPFDLQGHRPVIEPREATKQYGDTAHLFCPVGFLDDSWWHRTFWLYGETTSSGYGSWFTSARYAPSGRLMVFDDDTVYAYGRRPEYIVNTSVLEFQISAADRVVKEAAAQQVKRATGKIDAVSTKKNATSSDWLVRSAFERSQNTAAAFRWVFDYPSLQARAMVLAGQTLFLAGPPDFANEKEAFKLGDDPETQKKLQQQLEALHGKAGGRLWAMSATDGRLLARYKLESLPAFDGLVAANGQLFLATLDGRVLCLAPGAGTALAGADQESATNASRVAVTPPKVAPATPRADKKADFDLVENCRVLAAEAGYRVEGDAAQTGLALKKLDRPVTKSGVFKVTLTSINAPGAGKQRMLRNGFLVLSDGAGGTLRCGVRLALQNAIITQATARSGDAKVEKMELPADEPVRLEVAVDLEKQKVSMTLRGKTIEAPLAKPLKAITHAGYGVEKAVTEFTAVEVKAD